MPPSRLGFWTNCFLDFDDGGFADICAIEYTIALSTPPAVEPPTFFEILHLDPYAYPFHPVESSSRIGGARTEAAERVIRDAWLERVGEYETADGGSTADDDIEEKHHDGDGATTQLGRHLAIINMVAHRLGKPRSRATYLTRFVRPSEERERDWRPRRGKLRLVCGSAWKPLRVSR